MENISIVRNVEFHWFSLIFCLHFVCLSMYIYIYYAVCVFRCLHILYHIECQIIMIIMRHRCISNTESMLISTCSYTGGCILLLHIIIFFGSIGFRLHAWNESIRGTPVHAIDIQYLMIYRVHITIIIITIIVWAMSNEYVHIHAYRCVYQIKRPASPKSNLQIN